MGEVGVRGYFCFMIGAKYDKINFYSYAKNEKKVGEGWIL